MRLCTEAISIHEEKYHTTTARDNFVVEEAVPLRLNLKRLPTGAVAQDKRFGLHGKVHPMVEWVKVENKTGWTNYSNLLCTKTRANLQGRSTGIRSWTKWRDVVRNHRVRIGNQWGPHLWSKCHKSVPGLRVRYLWLWLVPGCPRCSNPAVVFPTLISRINKSATSRSRGFPKPNGSFLWPSGDVMGWSVNAGVWFWYWRRQRLIKMRLSLHDGRACANVIVLTSATLGRTDPRTTHWQRLNSMA